MKKLKKTCVCKRGRTFQNIIERCGLYRVATEKLKNSFKKKF